MFDIEFYENANGYSEVWEWLEELRLKAKTDKNARIQYNQAVSYIDLLAKNGTQLSKNVTKHLDENIWELRPGNNRILYFFQKDEHTYVLLHHFRKKTQKTPPREIIRAKSEKKAYLERARKKER